MQKAKPGPEAKPGPLLRGRFIHSLGCKKTEVEEELQGFGPEAPARRRPPYGLT